MSRHTHHGEVEVARQFPNNFADYINEELTARDGKVSEMFASQLRQHIAQLLHHLETEYNESTVDWKDYTVYTGTTGVAMLYLHMAMKLGDDNRERYLRHAATYVDNALKRLKQRGVSLLGGDAGPLALGSVVYHSLHQQKTSQDCLDRLLSMSHQVVSDQSIPDEVLFGRSGYLLALLFVRRHLGHSAVPQDTLHQVCACILNSGRSLSRAQKSSSPLMYEWHEKKYLGAAHGLVGILHTLLQVNDESVTNALSDLIKPTIDYLMTLRFPSGNYPSSIGSSSGDLLVHWCHGAPGWVHLFTLAYKVFGDVKYMNAAKDCTEVLWTRGLLRKGYGICHGVAGNAYGFLSVYQMTSDPRYLYRAIKFAEWCFDYGKHGCRIADRPYSLFEGLAGTIYFLVDLLDPQNANFPAFFL